MKFLYSRFEKIFDKKIDGIGLDIFRMVYTIILFLEIRQLYNFRQLVFDRIPFIESNEIDFGIPLILWMFVIFFLFIGFKTRFFTIINYLLTLIILGTIKQFEYHVFYAYLGINFLLMFTPVNQCFSVDRILKKLKYSNTTFQYSPPKTVSQFFYFLIPFVAIGLVYFDSIFHKFASPMWKAGLGVWQPASYPFAALHELSSVLNQEWLMYTLGYLTLFFELLFIFLFFRKRARLIMLVIGVGLHIGILISFPIPWFALTAISVYILLIPVNLWRKFQYKSANPSLFFYFDKECPLCIRTKIVISSLDWFGFIKFVPVQSEIYDNEYLQKVGIDDALNNVYSQNTKGKYFEGYETYLQVFKRIFILWPLFILGNIPGLNYIGKKIYSYIAKNRDTERCTEDNCGYNPPQLQSDEDIKILQNLTVGKAKKWGYFILTFLIILLALNSIYLSPLSNRAKRITGWNQLEVAKVINTQSKNIKYFSKVFLGITTHGVFMDAHFREYNHIIQIDYVNPQNQEVVLPIIDNNGQPVGYNSGFAWVNFTFNVNQGDIDQTKLNKGIERYTAFWAHENVIDLNDAKFVIKVKKIDSPTNGWEKDFLENQIAKPWIDGGYVLWKNKKFESHIKDIESL